MRSTKRRCWRQLQPPIFDARRRRADARRDQRRARQRTAARTGATASTRMAGCRRRRWARGSPGDAPAGHALCSGRVCTFAALPAWLRPWRTCSARPRPPGQRSPHRSGAWTAISQACVRSIIAREATLAERVAHRPRVSASSRGAGTCSRTAHSAGFNPETLLLPGREDVEAIVLEANTPGTSVTSRLTAAHRPLAFRVAKASTSRLPAVGDALRFRFTVDGPPRDRETELRRRGLRFAARMALGANRSRAALSRTLFRCLGHQGRRRHLLAGLRSGEGRHLSPHPYRADTRTH